jgi:hypothetical protein
MSLNPYKTIFAVQRERENVVGTKNEKEIVGIFYIEAQFLL